MQRFSLLLSCHITFFPFFQKPIFDCWCNGWEFLAFLNHFRISIGSHFVKFNAKELEKNKMKLLTYTYALAVTINFCWPLLASNQVLQSIHEIKPLLLIRTQNTALKHLLLHQLPSNYCSKTSFHTRAGVFNTFPSFAYVIIQDSIISWYFFLLKTFK